LLGFALRYRRADRRSTDHRRRLPRRPQRFRSRPRRADRTGSWVSHTKPACQAETVGGKGGPPPMFAASHWREIWRGIKASGSRVLADEVTDHPDKPLGVTQERPDLRVDHAPRHSVAGETGSRRMRPVRMRSSSPMFLSKKRNGRPPQDTRQEPSTCPLPPGELIRSQQVVIDRALEARFGSSDGSVERQFLQVANDQEIHITPMCRRARRLAPIHERLLDLVSKGRKHDAQDVRQSRRLEKQALEFCEYGSGAIDLVEDLPPLDRALQDPDRREMLELPLDGPHSAAGLPDDLTEIEGSVGRRKEQGKDVSTRLPE